MEYEVRFYYSYDLLGDILSKLRGINVLVEKDRSYEKTIMYNHCDKRYDFYSKDVDGRFRLRITSCLDNTKCKLSWKRRLDSTYLCDVNKEEEYEVRIDFRDIDNFKYIIDNVMHFNVVSSYERYRTIFDNEDIEISVDEYPFGVCLEIENKSTCKDPNYVVKYYVDMLGLDINNSYRLSFDDKYEELCKSQNVTIYNEISFDKEMPKVEM